ncbi:MAG: hypothetical protein J7L53_10480 [Deltaproteobacteria bacterium]|nr:hypothetical protein [Deltaproteobacteria bacterium]
MTEGSTLIAVIGRGDEGPTGSETVARYQRDSMGTREARGVLLNGVCSIKPISGKTLQMALWESDQLIVPRKQSNVCGGKGLAGEPLGQGYIFRTQMRVRDVNKTDSITYQGNDREVSLKSRMRENLKSGSVRGLIVASGQNNPQRRWL